MLKERAGRGHQTIPPRSSPSSPAPPRRITDLADAYSQIGREAEAIQHWEQALASQPQGLPAWNNLAWALATSLDASLLRGSRALQSPARPASFPPGKSHGPPYPRCRLRRGKWQQFKTAAIDRLPGRRPANSPLSSATSPSCKASKPKANSTKPAAPHNGKLTVVASGSLTGISPCNRPCRAQCSNNETGQSAYKIG